MRATWIAKEDDSEDAVVVVVKMLQSIDGGCGALRVSFQNKAVAGLGFADLFDDLRVSEHGGVAGVSDA